MGFGVLEFVTWDTAAVVILCVFITINVSDHHSNRDLEHTGTTLNMRSHVAKELLLTKPVELRWLTLCTELNFIPNPFS